jgi:hypothetical protein
VAGVLLERWSHACFTSHSVPLLPAVDISAVESMKPYSSAANTLSRMGTDVARFI